MTAHVHVVLFVLRWYDFTDIVIKGINIALLKDESDRGGRKDFRNRSDHKGGVGGDRGGCIRRRYLPVGTDKGYGHRVGIEIRHRGATDF